MMTLPIEDLIKIRSGYRDCYNTLFDMSFVRLRRSINVKLKAIKYF
jgi:hypothetical protein